ncbi:hypothetical protein JCM5350_000084 [Sporobolomyces pararoseus]
MTSPAQDSTSPPPSNVGTHCSLSSCNALDFLPIKCNYCSSSFCRHHASPSSHSCPLDPTLSSNNSSSNSSTGISSTRTGPELKELLPDAKRNKLMTGIHSESKTVPMAKPLTKQQLALASLKKSIDAKKSTGTTTGNGNGGTGMKEKKVNPTIELMKLKQRAKGADPRKKDGDVPMGERWYLTVKLVEGESRKEMGAKEVWLQKNVTGGKALDLFADLFKVSNVNHLANHDLSKHLSLALPSTPTRNVDLSARIDTLTSNGSSILLCQGVSSSV